MMPTLFVVHLLTEDALDPDSLTTGTPLCAFATREEADYFCRSHWQNYCADLCPADYIYENDDDEALDQGFSDLTSFAPEVFHDWCLDHQVTPPTQHDLDDWLPWEWQQWWQENVAILPEATRRSFWGAFDKANFFKVVDVEFDG